MKMSGKSLVLRHRLCSESLWMRQLFQSKFSPLKSALAGFLALLILLLTLASASHWLHHQLHASADHDQTPCAVCTITQGQLDAPVVAVSEVFASLSVAWTLPTVQALAPAAIDLSVAPNRGPPASVSSQS